MCNNINFKPSFEGDVDRIGKICKEEVVKLWILFLTASE